MNDELKPDLPLKYIVAGNYNEYQAYVKRKPRIECYYKYVAGPLTLRGLSDIDGFYIGSYESRPDIEEIKSAIAIIKAKQKTDRVTSVEFDWDRWKNSTGFVAQEVGPDIASIINGGDVSGYIDRIEEAKRILEKELDEYDARNKCE